MKRNFDSDLNERLVTQARGLPLAFCRDFIELFVIQG